MRSSCPTCRSTAIAGELDAKRFHRTENGVVLVTRDMLAAL